jgi:2-C-methyl-D-erythritol 4-phosphate cytidylyltransferase
MQGIDKILVTIAGRPVLHHSLEAFDRHPAVEHVVVVSSAEGYRGIADAVKSAGLDTPWSMALGGARRQDSVQAGLAQVPSHLRLVVIHDAARPFVTQRMISEGLAAAEQTGAAVAGIPSRDTAKLVGPDGLVRQTVERSLLWMIQTPQVFRRDRLEFAFAQVTDDVTDEATMLERCGQPVRVFQGSPYNLKITVPEDLPVAEAIARELAQRRPSEGAE